MDHLVVLQKKELNKIRKKRQGRLVWVRKRREPPVGVVRKGDQLFFKSPGGGVFGWTRVTSVKDQLKGGRYFVSLGIIKPRVFPIPFPIVKRDRRSWVTCQANHNLNQQQLMPLPSPTLEEIERAIRKHYHSFPSKKEIIAAIRYSASEVAADKNISATLFLLVLMFAFKNEINLQQNLKDLLNHQPIKVFPLSVFRGK